MIVLRDKSYARILNTNISGIGFTRGRNYDQDLGRLGKIKTAQREISRVGDLRTEARKMSTELGRGLTGNI